MIAVVTMIVLCVGLTCFQIYVYSKHQLPDDEKLVRHLRGEEVTRYETLTEKGEQLYRLSVVLIVVAMVLAVALQVLFG